MPEPRLRNVAIGALAIVHGLGVLGAPFAAALHFGQPDATAHQNFHVVWEAFKYCAASLACVAIALGPLRRGERWAWWTMLVTCLALFGGVFVAHALSWGGPAIDHWSYGSFLVISIVALAVLARVPPHEYRWRPPMRIGALDDSI
jgi:peptidoglycan/LPS O-acetylase OafA/YrhL